MSHGSLGIKLEVGGEANIERLLLLAEGRWAEVEAAS